MNQQEQELIAELNSILTTISIGSEELINGATESIQYWIGNTRDVKGYCRT